ncbi:protein trigalactosyldiacylglycerol chloroplastic-like [Trifolium pratense]|uniref:Protein trigalactosyldiacylglycerol chloroplastic-like n=1 Tax=Trifolium pratense TaxID=57577 RepID=A0A2K3NQW4_TRIPR|nr:protein trigalactosyldiacylglycerol chloroplastic-like [Trifolium pratense]
MSGAHLVQVGSRRCAHTYCANGGWPRQNHGKVLLYDEPTAGLDPIASTVVEDLIRSVHIKGRDALGKPGNITSYVVVTHQHSTIKRAIDRLLFLHKGQLVWEGMTHEFTTSTNPIVQQDYA